MVQQKQKLQKLECNNLQNEITNWWKKGSWKEPLYISHKITVIKQNKSFLKI